MTLDMKIIHFFDMNNLVSFVYELHMVKTEDTFQTLTWQNVSVSIHKTIKTSPEPENSLHRKQIDDDD